jgi:hypothetical protein
MEVDAGISQEEVIGLVKAMEDVWRQVDEDPEIFFVKNRVINFVTKAK